jgi:phage portal protein BeeE
LDSEQSNQVKAKIFNYLGINEAIINGSYDENTFQAFYKSTVEPIAIQLSQEFTAKVFSPRERQFGNSIVFESDHLNFMNNSTKVNYIKELMVLGLLSTNEARAIMNLEPIENDRFLQTLNVANTAIVDNYQLKDKSRGLDNERV